MRIPLRVSSLLSCSLREHGDQEQDVTDGNGDIVQRQDQRENLDENPDVSGNAARPGSLARARRAAFAHVHPPFVVKLEA